MLPQDAIPVLWNTRDRINPAFRGKSIRHCRGISLVGSFGWVVQIASYAMYRVRNCRISTLAIRRVKFIASATFIIATLFLFEMSSNSYT